MKTSVIGPASTRMTRTRVIAVAVAAAVLLSAAPGAGAKGKPGGGEGVSHTAPQTGPIELGTSGGWRYDLANGYCCGGTLGALVEIGQQQFILSNWHVLSSDTVGGDNEKVAETGDPVIQPGLIDVRCNAAAARDVGTLLLTPAPNALLPKAPVRPPMPVNVDAAIALVVPGTVSPDGAILEVGPPSSLPLTATLGLLVKKSGRTTGLTHSLVTGVHGTVSVSYENECTGGPAFTKTYTEQIIVRNRGSRFLDSGDSGSLLLEDVDPFPRPVGLLFAGSNTIGIANPIGEVLSTIGNAKLVGAAAVVGATGDAPLALQAAVDRARAAQVRHARALERVPDAVGHAVGLGPDGQIAIEVLVSVDSPRARAAAPRSLDGVPVVVQVVGRIVAY